MQNDIHLKTKISALPKIELHIHLEGCISLSTLKFLAKKNGIEIPKHLAEKENIYFENFDEFVNTFYAICNAIVEEEDLKFIIMDLVDYVRRNNIIYTEVSWTPLRYLQKGFDFAKSMEVMNNEIAINNLSDVIYFIIDTQRDHGTDVADFVFNKVLETKNTNIVGIGMTGYELGYSSSEYAAIYERMRNNGYGCTAHAGEYGIANNIWQCLLDLKVKRIGHGIKAASNPDLINYIKEHNIHLEISPSSNVRLCRVENFAAHPIKNFIDMDLNIGINSDDPGIFNTDLNDEYMNMIDVFNLDIKKLKQCNLNATNAAFASSEKKQTLINNIERNWN